MFVCIEFWPDNSVNTVYGPFSTLEEAEEFRKKQKSPVLFEPYLFVSPTEAN